jgi:hypothetical protein
MVIDQLPNKKALKQPTIASGQTQNKPADAHPGAASLAQKQSLVLSAPGMHQ